MYFTNSKIWVDIITIYENLDPFSSYFISNFIDFFRFWEFSDLVF